MSGNDVRYVRIGDSLDLVLEPKLALLQPRQLQLIGSAVRAKSGNLLVESAMLRLKRLELSRRTFVIVHGKERSRQAPPMKLTRVIDDPRGGSAER
jgi:hypothetical protein